MRGGAQHTADSAKGSEVRLRMLLDQGERTLTQNVQYLLTGV